MDWQRPEFTLKVRNEKAEFIDNRKTVYQKFNFITFEYILYECLGGTIWWYIVRLRWGGKIGPAWIKVKILSLMIWNLCFRKEK